MNNIFINYIMAKNKNTMNLSEHSEDKELLSIANVKDNTIL